jgi:hypothetical protein
LSGQAGAGKKALTETARTGLEKKAMYGITTAFAMLFAAAVALTQGDAGDARLIAQDEQALQDAGVSSDGTALLNFFRQRTLSVGRQERIATLIRELGDQSYKTRERASAELVGFGAAALHALRDAQRSHDLEVSRRAEGCLRRIEEQETRIGLAAAAARLLALRKPPGAAQILVAYLPFAEDEAIADEVEAVLLTLARHDSASRKALTAALGDVNPTRRGVCAEVLCRLTSGSKLAPVRRLLKDEDHAVRLRVALALAAAKEKDAIPVIIDLLVVLPQTRAWQAEDFLLRLADENGPQLTWKADPAGRNLCRDAWARWWNENRDKIDLAHLERQKRWFGYTMIVLLDEGKIIELDITNHPRLKIEGLQLPLDAQMLPGDRVLVAEHKANRVTLRSHTGEILWEKHVDEPLMAQRLANGNTFIATEERLIEVDRDGKDVFTYSRPGDGFRKAVKLPNGEIACVTSSNRFLRIDSSGREIQNFIVHVATKGGRIEVLPRGRILLAEMNLNRIVEYDASGRIVWTQLISHPVAAVRLGNGNTLITSMSDNRAVELDRQGKEVWEYRTNTKVTRAFRR